MNYKVGDKVRVRKDLEVGKKYGECVTVERMENLKGKIVTIKKICGTCYRIEEEHYSWTDEMLEPVITNWDKVKEELNLEDFVKHSGICSAIHRVRKENNCNGMYCEECKKWLGQPYKEPSILNDTEKEYLKTVIKPWRKRIISIKVNIFDEDSEYISIKIKDDALSTSLPTFKEGAMYKGMIRGMEYTLEDLDL